MPAAGAARTKDDRRDADDRRIFRLELDPVAVQLDLLSKFALTRDVDVKLNDGDPRATAANVPITATPAVAAPHFFLERNARKVSSSPSSAEWTPDRVTLVTSVSIEQR